MRTTKRWLPSYRKRERATRAATASETSLGVPWKPVIWLMRAIANAGV
jgi:2-keto-4-pentenoate hydratase